MASNTILEMTKNRDYRHSEPRRWSGQALIQNFKTLMPTAPELHLEILSQAQDDGWDVFCVDPFLMRKKVYYA
jgi:hypothetical protein